MPEPEQLTGSWKMRYDSEFGGRSGGYDRGYGMRRWRGGGRPSAGYDRPDYWWIGERAMPRGRPGPYDADYERFSRDTRPRYSPVGGMYGPMGGDYIRRTPRYVREPTRFSEWTRWF